MIERLSLMFMLLIVGCSWVPFLNHSEINFNEEPIIPCLTYSVQQEEYMVQPGDCPEHIFGVQRTPYYVKKNEIGTLIYPGDRLSFYRADIRNLYDIRHVWYLLDSLTNRHITELLIVIRDKGEAYFVIRSREEEYSDQVPWSTYVSVGRRHSDGTGGPTPIMLFQIVEKRRVYRSKAFDCFMFYAQRFGYMANTADGYFYRAYKDGGYFIHFGITTGRPESHGCVRIPKAWAVALWDLTQIGTYVLIVDEKQLYDKKELISIWEKSQKTHHRVVQRIKIQEQIASRGG